MPTQDPHLNVFHAYRGAAIDDVARSTQLEDNLTRALAITLGSLNPGPALDALLDALHAPDESTPGSTTDRSPPRHSLKGIALQVTQTDDAWPGRRALVVIHAGPTLKTTNEKGTAQFGSMSRPDAVVVGADFVLGIESKVTDTVTSSQLDRHRAILGIGKTETMDVTWDRLARTARAVQSDAQPESAQFLLRQFEEYLRMNGFGGLTNEHFAYFAMNPDERKLAEGTKDAIARILLTVASHLGEAHYPNWGQPRRGKMMPTDTDAWAAIDPPPDAQSAGHRPHLTVFMNASKFGLFANLETALPYQVFRRAWKRAPDLFIDFLRGLDDATDGDIFHPWRLDITHRIQVRAQLYRDEVSLQLSAPTARLLTDNVLRGLIDDTTRKPTSKRLAAPQISITREYPASIVLSDPDSITGRLTSDAATLTPFFNWLDTHGFREA